MLTKILRHSKATIPLEEISVFDTERVEQNVAKPGEIQDVFYRKSKIIGDLSPFIRIEEFDGS